MYIYVVYFYCVCVFSGLLDSINPLSIGFYSYFSDMLFHGLLVGDKLEYNRKVDEAETVFSAGTHVGESIGDSVPNS